MSMQKGRKRHEMRGMNGKGFKGAQAPLKYQIISDT